MLIKDGSGGGVVAISTSMGGGRYGCVREAMPPRPSRFCYPKRRVLARHAFTFLDWIHDSPVILVLGF